MTPYNLAIAGAGFLALGIIIGFILGFCFSTELERKHTG